MELFLVLTVWRLLEFFFWSLGRPVVLSLYRWYLRVRTRTARRVLPSRGILSHLTTTSVMYGVLILLTLFVATNNLLAREVREHGDEQGVLASLIRQQEGEEVVEEGFANPAVSHYRDLTGFLTTQTAQAATVPEADINLPTAIDDSSLVLQNVPTTNLTEVGRTSVTTYTIEPGDTISTIAHGFGLGSKTILWANGLSETSLIKPGDILKIPPINGVVHTVKGGETLKGITTKYKANLEEVIEFNQLAAAADIDANDVLIIPGGEIEEPKPAPDTVRREIPPTPRSVFADRAPEGKSGNGGWLWPTDGHRIFQYFRWRHTGIDIDGTYQNKIYAARAGRVVKAQGGWNGGYGNMVQIDHGDGTQSLYAHASKLFVRPGQQVAQGQTVAMVGTSGRSTGTHLHFEVFVGGRKVNPLGYVR